MFGLLPLPIAALVVAALAASASAVTDPAILKQLPGFVRTLNETMRDQYIQLVTSETKSKREIMEGLGQWAKDARVVKQFDNLVKQRQKAANDFHEAAMANLNGPAKELAHKLWALHEDDTLTRVAECTQMRAAINDTPAGSMPRRVGALIAPALFVGPLPRPCAPPTPTPQPPCPAAPAPVQRDAAGGQEVGAARIPDDDEGAPLEIGATRMRDEGAAPEAEAAEAGEQQPPQEVGAVPKMRDDGAQTVPEAQAETGADVPNINQ